ncbi:energy transducer TonB [Flavobacterium album]
MKKILFLLLLVGITAMAQETTAPDDNEVYNSAGLQVRPEYPGGMQAFYQYVSRSFRVPDLDNEEDISAKIYVTFVVEKDGSLTGIKALRDPGYGLGYEAVRVLKLCEKWSPGMQNGKAVRTNYTLPIAINITGTHKLKEEVKEEVEVIEPVKPEAKPKVTKVAAKKKQSTTKKKNIGLYLYF